MTEEQEISNRHLPTCCLALAGYIVSIITFIWGGGSLVPALLFGWVTVFYCAVLYYGVRGYREPHGNLVRYLMLIFAVYVAASAIPESFLRNAPWPILLSASFAAMSISYMAGRLNKIKKNRYVAALSLLLLLVRCLWFLENPGATALDAVLFVLERCQALFMWMTVVLIYFLRYREHAEAGLAVDTGD